jgi:CelD/BcsL family acetyltransferase involved in cellulose biosynthesis
VAVSLLVRPELGHWAAQWDRLIDLSPLPSPFLRSWWLTGTAGSGRHFVLVVHGDVLMGGLALEERRRLGLPFFTMMGAGPLCPDHLDLLADRGHEDDVKTSVAAWLRRPGTRVLNLEGIDADSLLIDALAAPVHRELLAVAPWAALPADPDAYLAARPALFRKNLRRASSRLAAEGVDHRIKRGSSAIRSLDTLRQLHAAQWGGRSRFLPIFGRFAAGCRLAAEVDEVAVHELAVDESVIAIVVVFEVAGRVSLYQSARLTDFRWRDATIVLLNAIIRDAGTRGFTEVDFLRGDEAYKKNFASGRRQLLRLRAASGKSGRVVLMAETDARKAKHLAARGSYRCIAARGKRSLIVNE